MIHWHVSLWSFQKLGSLERSTNKNKWQPRRMHNVIVTFYRSILQNVTLGSPKGCFLRDEIEKKLTFSHSAFTSFSDNVPPFRSLSICSSNSVVGDAIVSFWSSLISPKVLFIPMSVLASRKALGLRLTYGFGKRFGARCVRSNFSYLFTIRSRGSKRWNAS